MNCAEKSHAFSIELKRKEHLKTVAIPSSANDNVVIEGFLGELLSIGFAENVLLEIEGTNGTLRIDMKNEELLKLVQKSDGEVK
jgi:hypothetical protein